MTMKEASAMKDCTIDGIDVQLDDDVDPHDVETLGGDPREGEEVDLEALEAEAREVGRP